LPIMRRSCLRRPRANWQPERVMACPSGGGQATPKDDNGLEYHRLECAGQGGNVRLAGHSSSRRLQGNPGWAPPPVPGAQQTGSSLTDTLKLDSRKPPSSRLPVLKVHQQAASGMAQPTPCRSCLFCRSFTLIRPRSVQEKPRQPDGSRFRRLGADSMRLMRSRVTFIAQPNEKRLQNPVKSRIKVASERILYYLVLTRLIEEGHRQ
jgi:hypothetical protein